MNIKIQNIQNIRTEQKLAKALHSAICIRKNTICLKEKDIYEIAGISAKTFKNHYSDLDEMIEKNNTITLDSLRAKVRIAVRLHFSLEEFFRQMLNLIKDDKENRYCCRIAIKRGDVAFGYAAMDIIKPMIVRYIKMTEKENPLIYRLYRITVIGIIVQFIENNGEINMYAEKLKSITLNFEGALKDGSERIEKIMKKYDY